MILFETERLRIRNLNKSDNDAYYDMMGNPNVMNLVPTKVMPKQESDKHLKDFITSDCTISDTKVWAVETKETNEFIGICAFLKNEDNDDEIGYRLLEKHWRKGYGTEITKGLISFGFEKMGMKKITADVSVKNLYSIKILEKFMIIDKEFYNEKDSAMDRRYEVYKNNWLK